MKKLVSTLNLDKKEWLQYRKQGIGGSDAGGSLWSEPVPYSYASISG